MRHDEGRSRPARTVGDLMAWEPAGGGLRGDPDLWRALRDRLAAAVVTGDGDQVALLLGEGFREVVGVEVDDPRESVYVAGPAVGGLSSGRVHLPTVRDRLIPLVVERATGRG